MQIGNAGIAVSNDVVVSAAALEFVERAVGVEIRGAAGVRARRAEARRIEIVSKICAGHKFDRPRFGAAVGILFYRAIGELDVDRSGR